MRKRTETPSAALKDWRECFRVFCKLQALDKRSGRNPRASNKYLLTGVKV